MKPCDVIILGAGSMGLSFALKMHEVYGNEKVIGVVCSRKENLSENIRNKGIYFQEGGSTRHIMPSDNFRVYDMKNIDEIYPAKSCMTIITTKTPNMGTIFDEYVPKLLERESDINFVVMQNGIYSEHIIIERATSLGIQDIESRLIGAVVLCPGRLANRENPEVIYKRGSIELGSWNLEKVEPSRIQWIAQLLEPVAQIDICQTGMSYKYSKYRKAIVNNANVLCATFGVTCSKLLENKILNTILKDKLEDYIGVMGKIGLVANFDELWQYLENTYSQLIPDHYTSMMHDLENQIRQKIYISTEINELEVYLCIQAKENEVTVPTTSFITELFTNFTNRYNMILDYDQEKAINFAKCFVNQNASIIEEEPFFTDYSEESILSTSIFKESEQLSQSYLRLCGEYLGISRQN